MANLIEKRFKGIPPIHYLDTEVKSLAMYEIPPFKIDFNVYVPILKKFYRILAADDVNKILGWNAAQATFIRGSTNVLGPGLNTGYQPVGELNPSEDELLQITGMGLTSPDITFQVKQPSGVDRFGTPAQAIGELDGLDSPTASPRLLHFFYVVANKQPSFQLTNRSASKFVVPQIYVTGYRYKWEQLETQPAEGKYQIVHIGGIQ